MTCTGLLERIGSIEIADMRSLYIFAAFAVATLAMPAEPEMLHPAQLAFVLNEDDFEEYLDKWLEVEEPKWANASTTATPRSGCSIRVRGDIGQPTPVYLHRNAHLIPDRNNGLITLASGEQVVVACTGAGRTINHPQVTANVATATARCVNNDLVSGAGWLNGNGAFGGLTCSNHAYHDAQSTTSRCHGNNIVIRVGFIVNNVFHPKFWSCFNQNRMEVLYVWYAQTPGNTLHQTGVDRPSWIAGGFFPGVNINNLYTQVTQRNTIAGLVGQDLANQYITSTQFLARGHLAAKSDFVLAPGQRSTFYFINAAPQWQPFNAGNWNYLEQNLRARIGQAGYHTTVYTGTFGVTALRNAQNRLVDIFLHRSGNTNQLPVPLYFYKVAYDANRRLGTAFISINNPYYTAAEVRALQFCTCRCRGNAAFNWLRWQPDRIDIGYSFCCTVADFRRVIPHLPNFDTNGLLT